MRTRCESARTSRFAPKLATDSGSITNPAQNSGSAMPYPVEAGACAMRLPIESPMYIAAPRPIAVLFATSTSPLRSTRRLISG